MPSPKGLAGEQVPFHRAHLAPDHVVSGVDIACDDDALEVNLLAFFNIEIYGDRFILQILPYIRLYLNISKNRGWHKGRSDA